MSYGSGLVRTPITAANKLGALSLTNANFPWVVDANAFWSGIFVPRTNRAAVRWPALWTRNTIVFDAVCTPTTFTDRQVAIVVDNVVQSIVTLTNDAARRIYTVPVTVASGGSTVEAWECWDSIRGGQNTGVDVPHEAGYVTGMWLPLATAPATYLSQGVTECIVSVGDSTMDAVVGGSPEIMGPTGQLRLLAHRQGKAFVHLDYGGQTLRGDGITPANMILLIQAAVASTGATKARVLFQTGRNDCVDFGATVSSTPAQVATDLSTIVTGLPAGFIKVIVSMIPQTDESSHGGGTIPQYRTPMEAIAGTNVIIVGGTTMGIIAGSDLGDGVHLNPGGVIKEVAGVRGPLNL